MAKFSRKFEQAIDYIASELRRINGNNSSAFLLKESEVFDDGNPHNHIILLDALRLFQNKEIVRYGPHTQEVLASRETFWPIHVEIEYLNIDRMAEAKAGQFLPKTAVVVFNNERRELSVNGNTLVLPPNSYELDFCRTMFRYEVGVAVDNEDIYAYHSGLPSGETFENEEMTGEAMRNTYRRLNEKAQSIGIEKLFDRRRGGYYIRLQ